MFIRDEFKKFLLWVAKWTPWQDPGLRLPLACSKLIYLKVDETQAISRFELTTLRLRIQRTLLSHCCFTIFLRMLDTRSISAWNLQLNKKFRNLVYVLQMIWAIFVIFCNNLNILMNYLLFEKTINHFTTAENENKYISKAQPSKMLRFKR